MDLPVLGHVTQSLSQQAFKVNAENEENKMPWPTDALMYLRFLD